jgi:alkylhydroperoxidase/carboxymuconolactone decarboxylase family protein YurZ
MFDRGLGQHVEGMAQELLRRPSTLEQWERELIFTFTCKLNGCNFCYGSHRSCTIEKLKDGTSMDSWYPQEVVDQVCESNYFDRGNNWRVLTRKMQALLPIAEATQKGGRNVTKELVEEAKFVGATDQEIHDTVAIAAMACFCNRYVDGLATVCPDAAGLEKGGKSIAKYGYKMTITRFFVEVLPQLWNQFRGRVPA